MGPLLCASRLRHFGLGLVDQNQDLGHRVIQRGGNGIANLHAPVESLREGPVFHHGNVALPRDFLDLGRQIVEALGHHNRRGHVRFVAQRDCVVGRICNDHGGGLGGLEHLPAACLALQPADPGFALAGFPSDCLISSLMSCRLIFRSPSLFLQRSR